MASLKYPKKLIYPRDGYGEIVLVPWNKQENYENKCAVNSCKSPHTHKQHDSVWVNPIILFRINADLRDGHNSGKQGMIGEENVVKVNLPSLFVTNKVSISVIDSVE